MKMRALVFAMVCVAAASSAAQAYDKYIPLGTGYSATVDSLPRFESDAGQVSQRSDEYETELYLENLKRAKQDSRLRDFFSDRNATGLDGHIDY
jgi:hypothetical protein